MRPMNSSKNKLNSKIIYNFHPNLNAQVFLDLDTTYFIETKKLLLKV